MNVITKRTTTLLAAAAIAALASAIAETAAADTPDAIAVCGPTSATAGAFAACVGTAMTAEEAVKCFTSGFRDCYGPSNDARKFVERNIKGPIDDVLHGRIGQSDYSVWRQIGLPPITW